MAEVPERLRILTALFPVCQHLVGHRLFRHPVEIVHQRIVNGVVQQLDQLAQEEPEQAGGGPEPVPEVGGEHHHQREVEGVLDASMASTPSRVEEAHHSDGCVTATGEDSDDLPSLDADSDANPRESTLTARGIPQSSSPRPESLLFNPGVALPIRAEPDSTCTRLVPLDIDSSDVSSDLPALTLPARVALSPQPPPRCSGFPSESHISSLENAKVHRFPAPLANVSLSEIQSPSDASSIQLPGPSGTLPGPRQSTPRGVNKIQTFGRRRLGCRRRRCKEHKEKMMRVMLWLIDGCENLKRCKCPVRGVGSLEDPFIVPDDSDDEED